MSSRDNYTFATQPRPVNNRPKYRTTDGNEPPKRNLMWDKRVARGSNFPAVVNEDKGKQDELRQKRRSQVPLVVEERPPTPEPVSGRLHISVQTDNYLEDLRDKDINNDFATQTDYDLDFPEPPLFIPKSSGFDIFTFTEEGTLNEFEGTSYDFDMEVEPVLAVITGKSLDQALMEVLEEEELKEIIAQRDAFYQLRNVKLAELQRLQAKDDRHEAEKKRRIMEAQRRAQQKDTAIVAAVTAKEFMGNLEDKVLSKLADAGYFYEPVMKQVQNTFLPWLVQKVNDRLASVKHAQLETDSLLFNALHVNLDLVQDSMWNVVKKIVDTVEETNSDKLKREQEINQYNLHQIAVLNAKTIEDGEGGEDPEKAVEGQEIAPQTLPPPAPWVLPPFGPSKFGIFATAFEYSVNEDLIRREGTFGSVKGQIPVNMFAFAEVYKHPEEVKRAVLARKAFKLRQQREKENAVVKSPYVSFGEEQLVPTLGFTWSEYKNGLYVNAVAPQGGAVFATLVPGDVVTTIGDVYVSSKAEFDGLVSALEPGEEVQLSVTRGLDGRKEVLTVEVWAENHHQSLIRQVRADMGKSVSSVPLLDSAAALAALKSMKVVMGVTCQKASIGVVVTEVINGPAFRAGILKDDAIVSFDSTLLTDPGSLLLQAQKHIAGEWLTFQLQTNDAVRWLELGAAGHTVEYVRSLRSIAGLSDPTMTSFQKPVFNSQFIQMSQTPQPETSLPDSPAAILNKLRPSFGFSYSTAPDGKGVLVGHLKRTGGAIQSLLVTGDLITKIDKVDIKTDTDLAAVESGSSPGDVLKVHLVRGLDGRKDLLSLEVGSHDASLTQIRALREDAALPVSTDVLLTKASAREALTKMQPKAGFRIADDGHSVMAQAIYPDGPAMRANLLIGDKILQINQDIISTNSTFIAAISKHTAGNQIDLHILRNDITMVLKLELGCKDAILDVEKLRCIRAIAELPTFNIDVID